MSNQTVYYYSLADLAAKHPAFLQGKALISIHDPYSGGVKRIMTNIVHHVEFSDVTELKWNERKLLLNEKTVFLQKLWLEKKHAEQDRSPIPFCIYHAIEMIKFIEINKEKDIVIQCDSGKNRSCAIALFLYLKYNFTLAQGKIEQYNPLILDILEKTFDKELYKKVS